MEDKFVSERNFRFMLYEVFDTTSLIQHAHYEVHSKEVFDMVVETALRLGRDLLRPHLRDMDKNPPELIDGRIKVHPSVKSLMREWGEGGWLSATAPMDLGGQQLPIVISSACRFIFAAANYSASVYGLITAGTTRLIQSHGTEEMIKTYLPKMFAGEWQGTMALTEPQAGSSLSDITTLALPTDRGYYHIKGQKIFITCGDHDAVENVVHMMLAKIQGAPPGVKGISLFLVPNKRIRETEELVPNDVQVTGIFHKMGYRGIPLTQLNIGENDDCRGYLVGEPNKGLNYMFQLVNETRIDIGICAAAIASAAYYASLAYTKERLQGRKASAKDPTLPQVRIIEHPDVKRMLLFQRSIMEGSLSLLLQCSLYADLEKVLTGEEKETYALLLALLTPVAKSYPSEMGVHSVSQGMQCLGGYGYCDEFPLEHYFRDARINPIHEGTTGIQAMDLLGRKITMSDGKAYRLYLEEVQKTIREAKAVSGLERYAQELEDGLDRLQRVTEHLLGLEAGASRDLFLADATLYLEFFGIISVAWQWLLQALSMQKALSRNPTGGEADFYEGKLYAFRFFFGYELPKIGWLAKRLMQSDGLTVEMQEAFFSD
jgi:butyryl-CoA dehydrogenase